MAYTPYSLLLSSQNHSYGGNLADIDEQYQCNSDVYVLAAV